ncbi:hypothetical protein [Gemmatimonas phototrophica]|uniref:Uncharacterized protein n=1 Tax=Gemmatimonas phototrophica TaxID=1379270 RepID=A0A143BM52_9BACT|nr:hypothetical protein [Gemmatimonas phototrophica]AMW05602.1 hypothetical protein GEMMAAP_13885 [Gemmatimonas phototrophica]
MNEFVFVGGLMVPFFITDRGLHRLRPIDDVDVVGEYRSRNAYDEFVQPLPALGFRVDQSPGAPVWYPLVMATSVSVDLPEPLAL